MVLKDHLGRQINYLRVSLTDRCNFRCRYCRPQKDFRWLPPEAILSYEELFSIVSVARCLGISRLRITGGEPLVRREALKLIADLAPLGFEDLALTTNGFFLAEMAEELKAAGLKRVNISLDSLDRQRFREITGIDGLFQVLQGIEAALEAGLDPVKINVVVMRGVNDQEVPELAALSLGAPLHVRFIEFMPVGQESSWAEDLFVPEEEIRQKVARLGPLEPAIVRGTGPAKVFRLRGGRGTIGFISSQTHAFCHRCNRLRLTPEGHLRPCLFADREIDLRAIVRGGGGEPEIVKAFLKALEIKPASRREKSLRSMTSIGG
ncbi:GTP 3',8-cyclase MoaA [Thermosulfuriphilus sp.]